MADEVDENLSRDAHTAEREPGEVVLRAERMDGSTAQSQIEPLEYSSPLIEPDALRPATKAWRVWMVICLCLIILLIRVMGLPEHRRTSMARLTDIASLEAALDTYQIDTDQYPSTTAGLQALVQPPAHVANWRGPYVKAIPADPWGRPYLYRSPGTVNKGSFGLFSAGPDKKFGTADDLVNWSQDEK